MSSREIADLVESRHDKVKQSIERLAARGVIQLPPLVDVPNHLGQTVSVYQLEKRDSLVHSQMIQNWIMSAKIRMLAALTEDESKFGGIYLDAYGREQDMSTLTEQPASAKEPAAPDAQPHVAVDKRAIQCGAQLGKVLRLLPLRPGHHPKVRPEPMRTYDSCEPLGWCRSSCLSLCPLQDAG